MQNRWQSKVLWVAIFALVYFVIKQWANIDIPQWDTFVDLLLTVLVGLGVLNNPTDSNNF